MTAQLANDLCNWISTWRNPPPDQHLAYAFKFTSKDWRTHNGYPWPYPGEWTEPERLDPITCRPGGVHVAHTVLAAQSGGAKATDNTLIVAYHPKDAGTVELSRQKVSTVLTVTPLLWIKPGAKLSGANLSGADLSWADLSGADLSGADLSGAILSRAILSRANLYGAYLSGADLLRADLYGADLYGADLSRAILSRAILSGANLSRANLSGADGRDDWDDLVERGAIRD